MSRKGKLSAVVGVLVAAGIIAGVAGSHGSHDAAAGHATAVSSAPSSVTEPSEPAINPAPTHHTSHAAPTHAAPRTTHAAPTHAAPTTPALSPSQQQAISAASSYLQIGKGFSRAGLIDQLHSPYGDGFSLTDATFAVDHLTVDWNQQAVAAAKGYLQLGTGFSRESLIDQLTSAYGDKFTTAQAEYAADHVGL